MFGRGMALKEIYLANSTRFIFREQNLYRKSGYMGLRERMYFILFVYHVNIIFCFIYMFLFCFYAIGALYKLTIIFFQYYYLFLNFLYVLEFLICFRCKSKQILLQYIILFNCKNTLIMTPDAMWYSPPFYYQPYLFIVWGFFDGDGITAQMERYFRFFLVQHFIVSYWFVVSVCLFVLRMSLINQFVLLHLRVLIDSHMFSSQACLKRHTTCLGNLCQ